jgi:hypothetical protein
MSLLVFSLLAASSCSFGQKKGESLAPSGPTVVSVRANPSTVELDRDYNARTSAEILAEVKDFTGPVSEVRLNFTNAPLQIPMEHVSGTTWRATLSPEQLRSLAVGNQTTTYKADVSARSASGATAVSERPVQISVKGPDISKDQG